MKSQPTAFKYLLNKNKKIYIKRPETNNQPNFHVFLKQCELLRWVATSLLSTQQLYPDENDITLISIHQNV